MLESELRYYCQRNRLLVVNDDVTGDECRKLKNRLKFSTTGTSKTEKALKTTDKYGSK